MNKKSKKNCYNNTYLNALKNNMSTYSNLWDRLLKNNKSSYINLLTDNIKIICDYYCSKSLEKSINNYMKILNQISDSYIAYINIYNERYNNALMNCIDKFDNKKYQEYIELITNIVTKNIEQLNEISNSYSLTQLRINTNNLKYNYELLTTQIKAIPKYLSYAYSNKSKLTMSEAYDKSIIKEISDMGNDIILKIASINDLYYQDTGKNITKKCSTDFGLIAVNIKDIADDESKFKSLITKLFNGIYEFTNDGNNNNLYKLSKEYNVDTLGLDLIKWYRLIYQHSTDVTDKQRLSSVYSFNKSIIKKRIPDKPSEYVRLQHGLYKVFLNMLNQIYENLNN